MAKKPLTPSQLSRLTKMLDGTRRGMNRTLDEMKTSLESDDWEMMSSTPIDNAEIGRESVVFSTDTWRQRWKLYRTFKKLAWSMLFSGKGRLVIKRRPANGR